MKKGARGHLLSAFSETPPVADYDELSTMGKLYQMKLLLARELHLYLNRDSRREI